ncbi:MAG: YraN family protein [Coriobacteriales bacterium]|jgi:putative endonuclease|nr:YraN family protein [Coriobacteriales bacterium]
MTKETNQIGIMGEEVAVKYLQHERIEILKRNWRCSSGEADIIAQEDDNLVFIEVKTRRSIETGFPEEAITKAKRHRYEIIAANYLSQAEHPSMRVRFDVISIIITGEQRAFLKHHRDVFCCGD